jgi:hypothetical protein
MRIHRTYDEHEYRLATRKLMRERGIALNPVEVSPARILRLEIYQDTAPLTSLLFRAESATECCLWLKIVSHAAEPTSLKYIGLQLPFTKEEFAWLPDPLPGTAQSFYRLPFSRDLFRHDDVINHRLHHKLLPGVPIEGFLLGVLHQPIPENVAGRLFGRLRILDWMGKEHCQRVSLYIDSRVFRPKPAVSPVKCDSSATASVNRMSR